LIARVHTFNNDPHFLNGANVPAQRVYDRLHRRNPNAFALRENMPVSNARGVEYSLARSCRASDTSPAQVEEHTTSPRSIS